MQNQLKLPSFIFLRLTCFFWLVAKLLCWKVWITERTFPTVPPFIFLLKAPALLHWLLFITACDSILFIIFKPNYKWLLQLLLVVELSSCLLDQTRWQPWEYQYLFILFIHIIHYKDRKKAAPVILFLLSFIYVYSGLQKFNTGFLYRVWESMFLKSFLHLPASFTGNKIIYFSGWLLAAIELYAGIGLLFYKTRKNAAYILMGMHVFTLIWLGPIGLRYNIIVWPWNVAMFLYLYLFFFFIQIKATRNISYIFNRQNLIVTICWGILPALSFVHLWPHYFSSSLYSGKLPKAMVRFQDRKAVRELTPYILVHSPKNFDSTDAVIDLQQWAMQEMRVPPFPEAYIYKQIDQYFQLKYAAAHATFYLYTFPYTTNGQRLSK